MPADFGGKTLQRRMQVRGKIDGHDLQFDHRSIQLVEFQLAVHPILVAAGFVDPLQGIFDPLDGIVFRLVIADTAGGLQLVVQQAAILGQGVFHVAKLADKLLPGRIDPQREQFRLRLGETARPQSANLGQRHPHVGHMGAHLGGQRQFADPPGKRFHQGPVGIRRVQAAARENRHHRQQQADADDHLHADRPFHQHHSLLKTPSGSQTGQETLARRAGESISCGPVGQDKLGASAGSCYRRFGG